MDAPSRKVDPSHEALGDPIATGVCEQCGATGAVKVGDRWLCENCYVEAGSCCPEFGASDLWEDSCRTKGV